MRKFIIILFAFFFILSSNSAVSNESSIISGSTVLNTGFNPSSSSKPFNAFKSVKSIEEICGLNDPNSGLSIDTDKNIRLVSVVVPCFENIMSTIAKDAIDGVTGFLSGTVAIVLTLYLIFFGIKVSTGITNEQKLKGEIIVHALKIAFITWLVFMAGNYNLYEMTLNVLYGFIKVVMSPVDIGDCKITQADTMQVWVAMDCLFSRFIGWGQGGLDEIPLLFGFVSDSLTGGFGGVLIASIILMTLWSLLMAFFRVAFAYMLAILTIVLLFVISPIMIPLMLFSKTKQLFENWWKMIVSMVLQPVIMFAFLAFIFSLMNEIVSGCGGISSLASGGGSADSSCLSDSYDKANLGYKNLSTSTDGDKSTIIPAFDINFGSDEIKNIQENKDMMFSLISMLVVSYLLLAFSKVVGSIGHELSGTVLTPNVGSATPKFLGGGGNAKL